jgi:peptidoglycan/LPS O-acetylase OafA/YrhL
MLRNQNPRGSTCSGIQTKIPLWGVNIRRNVSRIRPVKALFASENPPVLGGQYAPDFPYNLEFVFGYLICKLSFDRKYSFNLIFVVIMAIAGALFLFMRFYSIEIFYFSSNLVFSIFASLLIYYSVHRLDHIRPVALFLMVGNISYSLYLVHNPLQGIMVRLLPFLYNELVSAVYLLLVIFAVTILIGYVYSFLFERVAFTKLLALALRRRE